MKVSINAHVRGSRNNLTQTIIIGLAGHGQCLNLSLDFDALESGEPGLARLLKWNGRLSPFLGRDFELASLRNWLNDPRGSPVQIIAGMGGVGKTRLAAEFVLEIRGQEQIEAKRWWQAIWRKRLTAAWKSGFSRLAELGDARPLLTNERALCVIDYPEQDPSALRRWVNALAAVSEGERKLRVLFVTREPEVVERAFRDCNVQHLLPCHSIQLAPIEEGTGYQVLVHTLKNLTSLGYSPISITELEFSTWLQREKLHASPLFVVALAIHLADTGHAALHLDGTRILDELCKREETRLNSIGHAHGVRQDHASGDVLAWATLLHGLAPAERANLCDILLTDSDEVVWKTLRDSGAIRDNAPDLEHVEPDLLAAWWLSRWIRRLESRGCWERHAQALANQLALRDRGVWSRCVPYWNRLGYDLAVRLGHGKNPIDGWIAQHILSTWKEHCEFVFAAFSRQKKWNGLQNSAVAASAVNPGKLGAEDSTVLACRLNDHAVYLAAAGQLAAARDIAREAVDILRRLGSGNTTAYDSYLAVALTTLGSIVSKSGHHTEALAVGKEGSSGKSYIEKG